MTIRCFSVITSKKLNMTIIRLPDDVLNNIKGKLYLDFPDEVIPKNTERIKKISCGQCGRVRNIFGDIYFCQNHLNAIDKNNNKIELSTEQINKLLNHFQQKKKLTDEILNFRKKLKQDSKKNKYFVEESAFDKDMKNNGDE